MVSYEPNEAVVEFGEEASFLGVLLKGELSASAVGDGGQRQVLGQLKAAAAFRQSEDPLRPATERRAAGRYPRDQLWVVFAQIDLLRYRERNQYWRGYGDAFQAMLSRGFGQGHGGHSQAIGHQRGWPSRGAWW